MKTGICIRPLAPVRAEASERSEMVTQLLFGQTMDVFEQKEGWCNIRNREDGYTGWVTSKLLLLPDDTQLDFFASCTCQLLTEPLTAFRSGEGETLFLPAGATIILKDQLVLFPRNDGSLRFFKPVQKLHNTTLTSDVSAARQFVKMAKQFSHAPYLWGGKSVLGIDCSGLTQLAATLVGVQLPRDASQQATVGDPIPLDASRSGDLAFFANTAGKITHVGILLGENQILHASGYVHVDILDEKGIYSAELKEYTHSLHSIRRIF